MRKSTSLKITAVLVAVAALVLLAGPLAAKPGSHPVLGQLELSQQQQQQIQNLRSAYREKLNTLDWSVNDGAHAPETLQQWRELRIALRAEIREVLTEDQRQALDASSRKSCPYSGQATPVRVQQRTNTLFL